MEALAVGLHEVLDENYLRYRLNSTAYLGNKILEAGIPIIRPVGGHAVFVDAGAVLDHIPWYQFPGAALDAYLYEISGIRASEIGSVAFSRKNLDGTETPAPYELMRMAIPRRMYTQSHLDYVAEAVIYAAEHKDEIRGLRFTYEASVLRHFTAAFEWVDD
jgi:tryptophanase